MHVNNKLIVLLAIGSTCFFACNDIFESTIDVEIPSTIDRLVVSSNIRSSIDSIYLHLSHSQNTLDNQPLKLVSDAQVKLKIGSHEITPRSTGFNQFISPQINLSTLAGQTAILEISHPLFETIYSSTIIPPTPIINHISYNKYATKDLTGNEIDELRLEIVDDPDIVNYYSLAAYVIKNDSIYTSFNGSDTILHVNIGYDIYLQADGLIFEKGADNNIVFSDASFSGKTGKLRVVADYARSNLLIQVVVQSLSQDRYQYEKSIGRAIENDGNPFVEPDNLHTNIQNGYGIFSIENEVHMEIEVE